VEAKILSGRLRKAIARVAGKPGSLRFRLARNAVGVMAIRALFMGLGFTDMRCRPGIWEYDEAWSGCHEESLY